MGPVLKRLVQLTFSCIFGVDREDGWLVDHSVDEPWTIGSHVTAVDIIHIELERAAC